MADTSKQHVKDDAKGRYFHQMLNMADDDLNPYQYRLLGHYIRVDNCWESVRTTARITRMSVGMVVKTRNSLQELGYIQLEISEHDTYLVTVVDRMAENVARYANKKQQRSPHEHGVHHMNTSEGSSVHHMKQRRTRTKEEEKDIVAATATTQAATDWPVLNEDDVTYPFVEARLSSDSVKGNASEDLNQSPPPIPNSARPLSSPRAQVTPAVSPSPALPKAKADKPAKPRSAKQEANDALVDALCSAWFTCRNMPIPDVVDYGVYAKYGHALVKGGITPDRFAAYIAYWVKAARSSGGWTLTLHSLGKPERMQDFLSWEKSQRVKEQSAVNQAYDPRLDPAYAPVQQKGDAP